MPPTCSTASHSAHNRVAVRCRADLEAVQTLHKYESAVVIKDPVAMKYHRMRPDEFFVLGKLDGRRSLEQIRAEYEQSFAPWKVTAAELNRLLFRFHQSGLTVSDAAMQGDRLSDRRRQDRRQRLLQQLSSLLFIRFPGFDPEPLLKRLYPLARPLLGWTGAAVAMAMCLGAMLLFLSRWDQFAAEFPRMNEWIRLRSILILAAVMGLTKALHELGHAVACKHFGGECHQIGPMLLVFTPALYCDTSDSWMLPSRWQRAAVGMAGIAVEVVLAAIATFLWASTAPGLIHSIAMNVMLVCSASTLLLNANPLLRYDGYYVLSDLCDVPNLGERARRLLSGHANRLLFGIDELPREPMTAGARFWMLAYAVAAAAYRWCLTLLILWFLALMLRPHGLESVGRLLCVLAAAGLVFTLLRPVMRFFANPGRRRQVQTMRTIVSMSALAGLIALAFYPLPAGVSAPARLIPRQETPIYISTPGLLHELEKRPGEVVSAGQLVATLVNQDIERQYLVAKGRYETQQQIVESIRRSALDAPASADELPAQEALLEDLRGQFETRRARREGLQLRAPAGGRLIAAPHRAPEQPLDHRLVSWSGDPTAAENQDCLLQPGDELMSIAVDQRWDAELVLGQSDVQRINVGAPVRLALEALPSVRLTGKVSEISRNEWTADEHSERRDDPAAARRGQPPLTSYVVRVQLDANPQFGMAGARAISRVETPSISVAGRVSRFLNSLFRFR